MGFFDNLSTNIVIGSAAVLGILVIVVTIVFILLYEKNRVKQELHNDLKKVVDQINVIQEYEFVAEKQDDIVLDTIKKDVKKFIAKQNDDSARLTANQQQLETKVSELSKHLDQWRVDMSKQLDDVKGSYLPLQGNGDSSILPPIILS